MEADEDRPLIKAALEGNPDAFGNLYERHASAIFRYLYAHLDNPLDAEDLTEEIFLRVWRSLPSYRDQGIPFIAFLFRVARNALIDHYRHAKRTTPALSLEDDQIASHQPDPADQAMKGMEHAELRNRLMELRPDYRTVLVLRFLSDLSPDEVAEVMGKSAGSIRVLQHRALAALRKLFVESE